MAVGLVDGHIGYRSFTDDRIADPALRPLMRTITVTERDDLTAAFPREIGCRMAVHLKDGARIDRELRFPRGHAANPLTTDEIDAKFDELTEHQPRNRATAHALRAAGWRVDELPDITALTELLAQLEVVDDEAVRPV